MWLLSSKSANSSYFFPSSGGVGQLGVLIALETLLQQLKGEKSVDVYGVVLRLMRSCYLMTPTLVWQEQGDCCQSQGRILCFPACPLQIN